MNQKLHDAKDTSELQRLAKHPKDCNKKCHPARWIAELYLAGLAGNTQADSHTVEAASDGLQTA